MSDIDEEHDAGEFQLPTKQQSIDAAEDEFHTAAAALLSALQYAHSPECPDNRVNAAFGRAVAVARKMIAADDKLQRLGVPHRKRAI